MQTLKLLLLSFILSINCFAQQKDTLVTQDPLKMHKWAVQFEVGNDFTLQSFDGLVISLKYHFTPKVALRFGVGASFYYREQDWVYREYPGLSIDQPFDYDSQDYIFISNILFYPNPNSVLKVYFGAGPRVTYGHHYSEGLYSSSYMYWDEYERESWSFGLNAVFGCEWFPFSFLSLFGEYSAYGSYEKEHRKETTQHYFSNELLEYSKTDTKSFQFRGNIARLGASFYF